MVDANPWRELPAAGEWSREDSGDSGLECPVCGADSGYYHKCVECGALDPGTDGDEGVDLVDPGSKPRRFLARCIQSGRPLYRVREWARGIRRLERAEEWVAAADDLSAALPEGVLEILLSRLAEVDDDLDDDALETVDGCREIQASLADRDDVPREVVGWLHERAEWLRDGRQQREDSDTADDASPTADAAGASHATHTAAVATDGGAEPDRPDPGVDLCPHDRPDRVVDETGGVRFLWCRKCNQPVARLDEADEVVDVLERDTAPTVDGGVSE
jgi:hypothetical protein